MTSYELAHFKKMVWVWQTKSLSFCLRYDPLIVFRRQNHITFIFIKTMSHDLLVQMAHWLWIEICENIVLIKIDITMTTINKKLWNWEKPNFVWSRPPTENPTLGTCLANNLRKKSRNYFLTFRVIWSVNQVVLFWMVSSLILMRSLRVYRIYSNKRSTLN